MAPDLVALQEIDPDGAAGLARSGVLDRFPYSVTRRAGGVGYRPLVAVPLVDAQVQDVLGRPFISATVMVGAKRLRLYTVHTVAPLGGGRAQWQAQLRRVRVEVRATKGALVVAGDFNASRYHPSFRRLLSDGLRAAHERRDGAGRRPGRRTDGRSRPCCGSTTSWCLQALRCMQSGRASVRAATIGR